MSWTRAVLGFICGVVATGPMTAAMVLWHRRLPGREKYPLPPSEITGSVMEKAGVSATPDQITAVTLIAHFAYGGATGSLYGLIASGKSRAPIRSGLVLGFLVWSLSYFGLLPALRILRPATDRPARRSCLMLCAHFIWGVCLCGLHQLLGDDSRRGRPALRQRDLPNADRPDRGATWATPLNGVRH